MALNKDQFKEWESGFRPGADIRVPQSRFFGLSGLKQDWGLEHLDDLEAPEVLSDASAIASGYSDVVDYPIDNLLAQHHVDRKNARDVFESIKSRGFDPDEPIRAVGDAEGAVILNGHHRSVAARAAGLRTIPTELISYENFSRGLDRNTYYK